MKKQALCIRCLLALTLALCSLTAVAQQTGKAHEQPQKVSGPVESLLHQARVQRLAHKAGMLRPVQHYTPGMAAQNGQFGLLRNPFARPVNRSRHIQLEGGKQLWGVLINRASWEGLEDWDRAYGAYSFTTASNSLNELYTDYYYMNINGGGTFYNGAFHGVNYYEWDGVIYNVSYLEFDTETWEQTEASGQYAYDDFTAIAYASAYDPTTGLVYAFNRDASGTAVNFSTIDYSVPTAQKIGDTERTYVALAVNAQGEAFAIGLDGVLYSIDKTSGAATEIGATGVHPAEVLQSAVFDMKDGTLYWAAVNEDKTSALYSVDTTTGAAAKELDFADGEEFVAIYVPVSADPGAPAAPEDITVSFAEGAFTGTVAFTIPAVNAGGEPMTGDVDYAVIADDTDTLVTGTAAAGSRVEETVTLTGGKHKLTIVLSNEHGNGKSVNVQTEWVGLDVPYSPDNVELAIDDATGKAVLTWNATTEGWNGGYIDPEQLSYRVTDFYTDEVLAEGLKDTRFEMNLEKGPYRPYRYTVTAFNGEVEAEWGNAGDAVRWGYPLEAPYANDVNTYELYDVLDIIDANNDRAYFKMSGQGAHNQPNWRGDTPSDDWLVLPPMQLKGNHTYNLSFDVSTSGDGMGTVEAGFGTDLEVAGYTMTMQPRNIDGRQTVECLIQISNDGVYRLGIHDLSAASQDFFGITISGIKVTEGPAIDAPAAVDDIVLTADAMGGMEVSGTFMTPTTNVGGQPLASLTKVEVYRDGSLLVATLDQEVQPGQQLSFTDQGMEPGNVSYTIVAYNEWGKGLENSASVMVGVDVPAAPRNIAITDYLGGNALMTWDAPTTGRNGRYIDPAELTYNIYSIQNDLLEEGLTERQFGFTGLPTDGQQYATGLYVTAQNSVGESDKGLGIVLVGAPYELPFHESFAEGMPAYEVWTATTPNSFQVFQSMSQDEDMGCIAFIPSYPGEVGTISSGKISLVNSERPKLTFYYWAVPRTDAEIKVLVGQNSIAQPDTVQTFSLMSGDQGWQKATVDLTPYRTDDGYITVQFCGMSNNPSVPPIIDNIYIGDVADNDLAIRLNAPSRVNVGAKASFQVKLSNEGNNDAHEALVRLAVNDSVVTTATLDVPAATLLYPNLEYTIPANLDGEIAVTASVEWSDDENADNNTSETAMVKVIRQDIPVVTDLAASMVEESGEVELTWTAPADEFYTYTEGFENYDPFSIANAGLWQLVDRDGQDTYGIGGTYYDNIYQPCAFMVFNPVLAGLDLEQVPQFGAHSGDQYMTTFRSHEGANNDWLISPELSGRAQTISFYCQSVSADDGLEEYEVLYSLEGTDPDQFQVIGGTREALAQEWEQISVDLPEGTRYFAIRCKSEGQFMFMVDDVTYEGRSPQVKGFMVYRDNSPIGRTEGMQGSERFTSATAGLSPESHVYNVTVLTEQGESDFSNDATVDLAGISEITADEDKGESYNIIGQRTSKRQKGIILTRKADGSVRKAVVR